MGSSRQFSVPKRGFHDCLLLRRRFAMATSDNRPSRPRLLLSQIFNKKHGLEVLTEAGLTVANELAHMIDDDIEGSKEERSFR